MVDLLESRANGQLPRPLCLEVTIIHWPQIQTFILFYPLHIFYSTSYDDLQHQSNASSATENRE